MSPAVSKSQQTVMGMAHAIQKGEMKPKPGTPSAEIAKSMKPSDVTDFASTPRKGLPKVKRVGKSVKKEKIRAKK